MEIIQSKAARLQSKDIRIKFVCVEFQSTAGKIVEKQIEVKSIDEKSLNIKLTVKLNMELNVEFIEKKFDLKVS